MKPKPKMTENKLIQQLCSGASGLERRPWRHCFRSLLAAGSLRFQDHAGRRRSKLHNCPAACLTAGAGRGYPRQARQRALTAPQVAPPPDAERPDSPLPVDASDHGSDTGETETYKAWDRQHPGIGINQERDIISDEGTEVYSYLQHQGIAHLLIMGVHTNMCVLHRTFAIKQMVRWGVDVALIRDLTDAMYNPAMPPYVSHDEGTGLVIEFIEKFWCPSVESKDLIGA